MNNANLQLFRSIVFCLVDMTQPTFAQIVKTWLPTTQSSNTKQPVEDPQEISSGLDPHRSFWHRLKRNSGFYEGNFVRRNFNRPKRQTQQSIRKCASMRGESNGFSESISRS